jgi:hypothetical protein
MLPDPFFEPDLASNPRLGDDRCRLCPQSLAGGFCGARILPDCLHIDQKGTVRVGISATAAEWFETLGSLGEVLHLTRNPVAVLARLGAAPSLVDWRNPVLPRDCFGQFLPNLAEYAALWAVREVSEIGVIYGLETRDNSGLVFERFLLPSEASPDPFTQFVLIHQTPCEDASPWFAANHAWSARRRASLEVRVPWLRARWEAGDPRVRHLRMRAVSQLLSLAAQTGLPLRTTLYQPSQMRTVLWTPDNECAASAAGRGQREFFHGDDVGLHLNSKGVAGVWLWAGQCACCSEERWSVELADHRDHIGLALMAATPAAENTWRNLIQSVLR